MNKKGSGWILIGVMFLLLVVVGFAGAKLGWFESLGFAAGEQDASTSIVSDELAGKSATLTINFRDVAGESPSTIGDPDGMVIGKNGGGSTTVITDEATLGSVSTYVGDVVDVYVTGNRTYYCEPLMDYKITTQAITKTIDCKASVDAGSGSTLLYWTDNGDQPDAGDNNLWAGGAIDYNLTSTTGAVLGADQSRTGWLKFSPYTDNREYHLCGIAVAAKNDLKTPTIETSGWEMAVLPTNLSDAAIAINTTGTTTEYDALYYFDPDGDGTPNAIEMNQFENNEEAGEFIKIKFTADASGTAAATTEATLDWAAVLPLDCTYFRNDEGLVSYGAFDESASELNIGVHEAEDSPAGNDQGFTIAVV